MSFAPISSQGNFINETLSIPKDTDELTPFLKTKLEEHARLINRKSTGQFEELELQINETYPGATPQVKRQVFRKIVNTGALPNIALSTTAHGIAGVAASFFFTHIYGAAWDPVGLIAIPIPNPGPTNPLEILVNNTNILMQTTVNLSAYTESYVVLEYYKA